MVGHRSETVEAGRDDPDRLELREAYERGRRDARADRKRHPVMMALTVLAAIVGVVVLALAAVNGSFGGAGQVVDQNLSAAADKAEPVVRDVAGEAGEAVREVGSSEGTSSADQPS